MNIDGKNDGPTRMVFLDTNIERNHEERETVFDRWRFGDLSSRLTTTLEHVEGTAVFTTREIPVAGSLLFFNNLPSSDLICVRVSSLVDIELATGLPTHYYSRSDTMD